MTAVQIHRVCRHACAPSRDRQALRFVLAATTAAFLVAGAGACEAEPLTEILIVVDTDITQEQGIDELAITVDGPDGQRSAAEGVIDRDNLPLTLGVVHGGGALGPVRVKVEGRRGTSVVVQRRAEVYFVSGEVRVLRMDLVAQCIGVACSVEESCGPGGCRPRLVPEMELPHYTGGLDRFDGGVPTLDEGVPDMMEPCDPVPETCNGLDDDCDGVADDGFDLQSDMQHCGHCGNACAANPDNASGACESGACIVRCDPDFADCNDDPSDGCEADLTTAATCGSCERACMGATLICDLDTCTSSCPTGTRECGESCVAIESSARHCGGCGTVCPGGVNASPLCVDGGCIKRCDTGFVDCDQSEGNGCEARLGTIQHCSACGDVCAIPNGVPMCEAGACAVAGCNPWFSDCDGAMMNGCEVDTRRNATHCGTCGRSCPVAPANAVSLCTEGRCGLICDPGFADCDMDVATGCERSLGQISSCGGCGISCDAATEVCQGTPESGFMCTQGCSAGFTMCADGSCTDTRSDVLNCGACGTPCATEPPNASPTCVSSECGFQCDAGFADCDTAAANGCEASLSSVQACGSCLNPCAPVANGMASCASGMCLIESCAVTHRDCDGVYASGCEVDISTDINNCGACGRSCTTGSHVLTVACEAGACVIATCDADFGDCDGDATTGCETNLTNRKDCGSCGNDCGGGPNGRCCEGVCGGC